VLASAAQVSWAAEVATPVDTIDFNRDIRPILSNNCYQCHGFDDEGRAAEMRLDTFEGATAQREDGSFAIVPGKSAESLVIERITHDDADLRMPPPDSGKELSAAQIELLRRWIDGGAKYAAHWSFVPPARPELPAVKNAAWARNPIDRFVLHKLEQSGLAPSPEADRRTLVRRVALDLTGLPPTPDEVNQFVADTRDDAYEQMVDRYLASPRYAERMTMHWLDQARYADTHGYNNDGERTQWPWRDWVLNAFHNNMPYDQFIVDQLAGDMRENATDQQRLATGFGRNHVITSEGGIIEEEYRVEYVADRVHTTATVFLGLSMQCARCHDHKFDPISQRDYFRYFAFFNNVPEGILDYGGAIVSAAPYVRVPSPFQVPRFEELNQKIANIERQRTERAAAADDSFNRWTADAAKLPPPKPLPSGLVAHIKLNEMQGGTTHDAVDPAREGKIVGSANWVKGAHSGALQFDGKTHIELGQLVEFEHDQPFSIGAWIRPTANEPIAVVTKMDDANQYRGFDLLIEQGKPAVHIIHQFPLSALKVKAKAPLTLDVWHHVVVTYDGSSRGAGVTLFVNGEQVPLEVAHDSLAGTIKTPQPVRIGMRSQSVPFRGAIDDVQFYSARLSADHARQLFDEQRLVSLHDLLAVPADKRSPIAQQLLRDYWLANFDEPHRELTAQLAAARQEMAEFQKSIVPTMVMQELPTPRTAHILKRGEYDQPVEAVTAGVPANLPPLPDGAPANRLGLAQWMVDPGNPLTARVTVNRWWQMIFGIGIVETVEDFGLQGASPSHPELLDWLATEFIASGWNVKALQKLIVTSATYRQSSAVTPALLERDPKNLLLTRGARFRLPAEMVRDNALAISGLLVEKLGGPSVYPYQPPGLWEDVSVEQRMSYKADTGPSLYRRGMYTFWKRTCPPPGMITFDAPDRETCVVRRAITNTPLQALVLMNDPTYVEAARKLAERVMTEATATDEARLDRALLLAVAREARAAEREALLPLLQSALTQFRAEPVRAEGLLSIGQSPRDAKLDVAELAAWTTLCSIILNLDETISKQ
jgi:hypothetical protein